MKFIVIPPSRYIELLILTMGFFLTKPYVHLLFAKLKLEYAFEEYIAGV